MRRQLGDVRHHSLAVDTTHDEHGRGMPRTRSPRLPEVGEPRPDGDRFQGHPRTGAGLTDCGHGEVTLAAHPPRDTQHALPARDPVHHDGDRAGSALGAQADAPDLTEPPGPAHKAGRSAPRTSSCREAASSRAVPGPARRTPTPGRRALRERPRVVLPRRARPRGPARIAATSSPPGTSIRPPPAASVSQFTPPSTGATASEARWAPLPQQRGIARCSCHSRPRAVALPCRFSGRPRTRRPPTAQAHKRRTRSRSLPIPAYRPRGPGRAGPTSAEKPSRGGPLDTQHTPAAAIAQPPGWRGPTTAGRAP